MLRRLLPASLLTLALAGVGLADEVVIVPNSTFKVPGGRIRGQVQQESPTTVKIQPTNGAAQDVPVDQIDSISYDGQPALFVVAQTSETGGNLADAIDKYKKAAGEAAGKPLILQAAQFGAARALGELALSSPTRATEALNGLDAFLKANARTRHTGEALELIAKLSLAKGDTDRADKALTELAAIPWAADRAAIMKARVQVKKGQADDALKAIDGIIAAAPKGSQKATEARLARAETLVALKKFDDAEATVKAVIKELPPEALDAQALAHNTLGDCVRAANRPKDALLAYLHTDILYDKNKEQHARALYEISQLWRTLKRDDKADEVVERLKQQYPQSPYLSNRGR